MHRLRCRGGGAQRTQRRDVLRRGVFGGGGRGVGVRRRRGDGVPPLLRESGVLAGRLPRRSLPGLVSLGLFCARGWLRYVHVCVRACAFVSRTDALFLVSAFHGAKT